jgi:hypothetical protein
MVVRLIVESTYSFESHVRREKTGPEVTGEDRKRQTAKEEERGNAGGREERKEGDVEGSSKCRLTSLWAHF